ncbi:cell surface hyaluronidase-like [Argopecten irradians]|uniref:cell surface hyaluronidase-like n=1 Tax=Argopecten irradians TaxID=31199 RepID=UPI0037236057
MEEVKIHTPILLDITPPDLKSITISHGGRLVWKPTGNVNLTVGFLLIEGRMDIGSDDCKYGGKTIITITGKRGQYDVIGFGEKFIGVDSGGILELHGREKLSWTKLNQTVPKLTQGHGYVYSHKESDLWKKEDWMEGVGAYVIDPMTDEVEKFRVFYLSGRNEKMTNYHIRDVRPFLKGITPGKLLFLSVQHSLINSSELSWVFDELEEFAFGSVSGRGLFRQVKDGDAYVMIAKAGDPSFTIERKHNGSMSKISSVSAKCTNWNRRRIYIVESYIDKLEKWKSHIDLRILDTDYAYPKLDVIDDVTSWDVGDSVVLTSTDFNWRQAEEATVVPCLECKANQLRIDLETKYTHWGEMINNVDCRGDVALLSRNIVLQGQMEEDCPAENGNCDVYPYDTFGAHMRIQPNFWSVHIQGVEVKHFGSQTELRRYPIHFHMSGDVDDHVRYPNPPYVANNSIHHTFARCVVVHATHGLQVKDNVCYDCLGHAFYIEDGGEKRTVLDGNLGASTRKGSLVPADTTPSTFWITNPLTFVRNNVAAGSENTGFWFVFPDSPIGLSQGLGFMAKDEARRTALVEFSNNVAHSNYVHGVNIDQKLLANFSIGSTNAYEPKEDPLNEMSPDKEVIIDRLTCFKNNMHNAWIRGGQIRITRSSFADSARGLTFARNGEQAQFLTDSVIIGESANIGDDTKLYNMSNKQWFSVPRSMPIPWDINHPVMGFTVYDGPIYLDNVWFDGFGTNPNYTLSAIGFQLQNKFPSSPVTSVSRLMFGFDDQDLDGKRIYDGNARKSDYAKYAGDQGATCRDVDGSLTSVAGSQVVKPAPFYTTESCLHRSNWNMAICPHRYGKLMVHVDDANDKDIYPIMVRDDIPHVNETISEYAYNPQYLVVLGSNHSYTLHWSSRVPRKFVLEGLGVEKDYPLQIGVCLPRDATFDLKSWSPVWRADLSHWIPVNSYSDLSKETDGGQYYWDQNVGLLFIKLQSTRMRTRSTVKDCSGLCPVIQITVTSGNLRDSDCRQRAYPIYTKIKANTQKQTLTKTLEGKYKTPPTDIGAGASRPFPSRTDSLKRNCCLNT